MGTYQKKTFFIKNMVCTRCIYVVKNIFEAANYEILDLQLGEIHVQAKAFAHQPNILEEQLQTFGLSLIRNKEEILVEKIKSTIIHFVHLGEDISNMNLSDYLSQALDLPYKQIRKTFREWNELTIEKYYILQKVERAKELLQYNDLSIKEIAFKLGYCSLQHLSNQFKTVTGTSPKAYKVAGINHRISVDRIGVAAIG